MERFGVAFCVVVACAVTASAAEMPARKAGLWEIETGHLGGRGVAIRECVDARTDQAMQANTGARGQCSRRDLQTSGNTTTFDSVCTFAGRTVTTHTVITGSFDSSYTMVVTPQGGAGPAAGSVTITAKWLGPCAAGQRPGDMIMPNGMKMNILDLQKGLGRPGAPMPSR